MSISISSFSIVSVVILPITQHFFPDHPELSEMMAESLPSDSGVPPHRLSRDARSLVAGFCIRKTDVVWSFLDCFASGSK